MKESIDVLDAPLTLDVAPDSTLIPIAPTPSNQRTARRARDLLVERGGYHYPSDAQRRRICVAFARRGLPVYGQAFDVVQIADPQLLDSDAAIALVVNQLVLCEIKATSKRIVGKEFESFFFSLTTAELLVAQKLRKQFAFVLVNVETGVILRCSLTELLGRAKAIYPTWSIQF